MTILFGCDFSSAPTRRKPIVVALGAVRDKRVTVSKLLRFSTFEEWTAWMCEEPAWIGGFDFPFGLPRELVVQLGWPLEWHALMAHYAKLSRTEIRNEFAAFSDGRPVGRKFAHRSTDIPAGSSSSMKWVNPPVAFMLHAGVPRLLETGAALPGLYEPAGASRIALEAYPGLLAREVLGRRSYKADDAARQNAERWVARADLLSALELGKTRLGLRLAVTHTQRDALLADAQGDLLDAVLCLVQTAWAATRCNTSGKDGRRPFGLPQSIDPIEGWILTA